MGDETEKYYTVQIKGKAYRFHPLDPNDVKRVIFISKMDQTGMKSFGLLCQVLAQSAGSDQWSELLDRYLAKELTEVELTSQVFARLIKRQDKDESAPVDAQ